MASVAAREWTHNGVTKRGWQVRWYDDQGVRRSKTCQLKKQADAFAKKVEREIEDGVHVAENASRTVGEAMTTLISHFEDRQQAGAIGKSHVANAEGAARLYIVPKLGRIVLRDLKAEQVAKFAQDLRRDGHKPASVRKYLATLRLMEKLSRKRGWLKTQPVADAIAELPRVPATRIETFKPDEVATLLGRASERRAQMNARPTAALNVVVHLAALCGLRMGEILGLPVAAIDLDRRRLEVRQAVSRFYDIKGPKTAAGFRTVPLPAPVVAVLRHWLETHYVHNAAGLLLTSPNGLIVRQGNLRVQWNTLLEVTELPPRHFHALRHFYASWHIANGTPAPDVAKLLGHSQFDMTLRVYTHALMQDDARVAQADRIVSLLLPADATAPQMALTY